MKQNIKVAAIVALILGSLYGAAWVTRIERDGIRAEAFLKHQCDLGTVEACKP